MARAINYIIVHCSATKPDQDIGAAEIDQWHKERGWSGIGYHYVVRRSGVIEVGRPIEQPGAHAKGYNSNSIGICMVGGVTYDGTPTNNFTKGQWVVMENMYRILWWTYPAAQWLGHRDLPGVTKACPCFDVTEWLDELRART